MANEAEKKDWRIDNVEKTKERFERARKIFFYSMLPGVLLFLISLFVPFFAARWLLLIPVALWYSTHCLKTVKAWENLVVFRWGKTHERKPIREPGLRWIFWPADTTRFVKMYERKLDIPPQKVIVQEDIIRQGDTATGDTATNEKSPIIITVDSVFWFKVTNALQSVIAIEDVEGALAQLFVTRLRNKCSGQSLQGLIASREDIVKDIHSEINTELRGEGKDEEEVGEKDEEKKKRDWGVRVTKLGLQDVRPPDDIVKALHLVFAKDKERRGTIIDADAEAQRRGRVAEGEAVAIEKITDAQQERFKKVLVADPELGVISLDTLIKFGQNKGWIVGTDLRDAIKGLLSPKKSENSSPNS